MDVVLDAGSLQILHASRSTGYDEHRTAIQILEGRDSILGILIVARTDDHDIGLGLESGINAFLNGLETEVIDYLVTSTSQEVARELGTSLTHGEVTDGEHEGCRNLGLFSMDTEILEIGSEASAADSLEGRPDWCPEGTPYAWLHRHDASRW